MSNTTYLILNTEQEKSRLQIFQHNYNRVTSTMHSVLELAVRRIDIILF